jgi:hypothetical protein
MHSIARIADSMSMEEWKSISQTNQRGDTHHYSQEMKKSSAGWAGNESRNEKASGHQFATPDCTDESIADFAETGPTGSVYPVAAGTFECLNFKIVSESSPF